MLEDEVGFDIPLDKDFLGCPRVEVLEDRKFYREPSQISSQAPEQFRSIPVHSSALFSGSEYILSSPSSRARLIHRAMAQFTYLPKPVYTLVQVKCPFRNFVELQQLTSPMR